MQPANILCDISINPNCHLYSPLPLSVGWCLRDTMTPGWHSDGHRGTGGRRDILLSQSFLDRRGVRESHYFPINFFTTRKIVFIFRLSHVRLLTSSPSFSPQKPVQQWPPLHTVRGSPQPGVLLNILVLRPPDEAGLPPWFLLPLVLLLGPVIAGGGRGQLWQCPAEAGWRSAQAGDQSRPGQPLAEPECGGGAKWRGVAHGQSGRGCGRCPAVPLSWHGPRVWSSEAGPECPQHRRGWEPGDEAGWRGPAPGLALAGRPPGWFWPRGLHQGGPGPQIHNGRHHRPDRDHLGLLPPARHLPRWVPTATLWFSFRFQSFGVIIKCKHVSKYRIFCFSQFNNPLPLLTNPSYPLK